MTTTKESALARVAAQQLSLVTVDDAWRVGMTTSEIEHLRRVGWLQPVRRGVMRVAGAPPTWEQLALSACLAAGPATVLSHATAAWVRRFLRCVRPARIDITAPWPMNPRVAGVRTHRVTTIDPAECSRLGPLPVTSTARTVIDVASIVRPAHLNAIVNDLLRRRELTIPALAAAADRVDDSRLRRRMKVIRQLIAAKRDGFHPGDSDPEVWMVEAVVAAGLGRPVQQYRVRARGRNYRLDAAYPEYKVGLEYEGADGHEQPGDVPRDRRRTNDLTAEGWDIRFATKETTERAFVADVRAALLRAGANV